MTAPLGFVAAPDGGSDIDAAIAKAAAKHGVDPHLLRAVGMQESGLGKTLDARGRGDGGHGYGVFQLDDRSHPRELLDRVAGDVHAAADTAAGMLRGLLDKYGGNVRAALSAYNSGNPNAQGTLQRWGNEMLGYADSVLRHMSATASAAELSPPPGFKAADAPAGFKAADDAPPKGFAPEATPSSAPSGGIARAEKALVSGKPFGKALATIPQLHGLQHAEDTLRTQWDYARQHPVDVLYDLLSSGQRALAADATFAGQPHTGGEVKQLQDRLRFVADAVFSPTAKKQDQLTASVEHGLFLPSHEKIDAFVNKTFPKELRPYASAILKGGEDFGTQTATDPLTYAPGFGELVGSMRMLMKGAQFTKTMGGAMHAVGLGAVAGHLAQLHTLYKDALDGVVKSKMGQFFTQRPELDQFFTPDGKKARISLENAEHTRFAQNADFDTHALNAGPDAIGQRYLQYVFDYGSPMRAKQAALLAAKNKIKIDLRGGRYIAQGGGQFGVDLSKADAAHKTLSKFTNVNSTYQDIVSASREDADFMLHKMRESARSGEIAQKSESYFRNNPGVHSAPLDWRKVPDTAKSYDYGPLAQPIRALMQAALYLNPLPHGIKNVGQLAYWAGGPMVVPRALAHMAKAFGTTAVDAAKTATQPGGLRKLLVDGVPVSTGLSDTEFKRMMNMGALPSYTKGARQLQSIWSKVPGWNTVAGTLQDAMGTMEEGWRKALLDHLDEKLGPSKSQQDELMKGWIINDRIGDYRNQAAFVKMFEALGGPFVAFRLGIVPKNAITTLKEHPERILAIARMQHDLQANRSQRGQHANEIEFGGPTSDAARLATDPLGYITSPATSGMLGDAFMMEQQLRNPGVSLGDVAAGQVSRMNPLAEPSSIVGGSAMGMGMPGQHMDLTDKLVTATLEALGIYYYHQKTGKQQARDRAMIRRGGI